MTNAKKTDNQETLILTSFEAVSEFFGVSVETARKSWRSRGMPCKPGGGGVDGHYDVREISRWLAARLRSAGAWEDPAAPVLERDGDVTNGEVGGPEFIAELRQFLDAHNWRGAVLRMLREWSGPAVPFECVGNDLDMASGRHGLVSGPFAIRFRGEKRYVWAGLSREFAGAVCQLVNSGAAWLIPPIGSELDDDDFTLDLPHSGNGDVFEPLLLSVNDDHRGNAVAGEIESVSKPRIKLKSQRDD